MAHEVVITPQGIQQGSLRGRLRASLPLLRLWVLRDLRARYRQSALRASWSVVQPVVLLLTYGWVFNSVLRVGDEDLPYLSFAWAGLVVFSFLQQAMGAGVGSILDSGFIISKVYFPREVLPLVVVGVASVDLGITFGVLVVVSWIQIGPPTVHVLGALAAVAVMVLLVAALTTVAASAAVFLRDVRHAMPLLLRVVFILSPVMYGVELLEAKAGWLVVANPFAILIEAIRDGTLRHTWPAWGGLAWCAVASLLAGAGALAFVRRAERRMSDRL